MNKKITRVGIAQLQLRTSRPQESLLAIRDALASLEGADIVVLSQGALLGWRPRIGERAPLHGAIPAADCAEALQALDELLRGGPPVVIAEGDPLFTMIKGAGHDSLDPEGPTSILGARLQVLLGDRLLSSPPTGHVQGTWPILAPSAIPFCLELRQHRLRRAARPGHPVFVANAVGLEGELLFDGGSFALDAQGRTLARLPSHQEATALVEFEGPELRFEEEQDDAELFAALVAGVGAFFRDRKLEKAWIGLSGGIDSALVACVAAQALGPQRVFALAMPSRYSDPRSTESALQLGRRLGIRVQVHPIEPLHDAVCQDLGDLLASSPPERAVEENLQARLRMLLLMAHVNRYGGALLNTSNQTELALGYGTLYGDLSGALSVLGSVSKHRVQSLSRWISARNGSIPEFILERPPTAELRPDQVDPFDYARHSPAVEALLLGEETRDLAPEEQTRLRLLMTQAQHKVAQSPPILALTCAGMALGGREPSWRTWT